MGLCRQSELTQKDSMLRAIIGFLLVSPMLQAASIRLQNDSICPLKAVIHGADGTVLNEVVVKPQGSTTWSDSTNPLQKNNSPKQGPTRSRTPFIVSWYCLDGEIFCISDNVSTGALVRTGNGVGKKSCSSSKQETIQEPTKESK